MFAKGVRRNCFLLSCLSLLNPLCARAQSPKSGTAPFILDGNRVYAQLEFLRPDATSRKTLVFVDLGSPSMVLSDELFKELHASSDRPLTFRIGEMAVAVDPGTVTSDPWLPFSIGDNRKVEGLLPAEFKLGSLRVEEVGALAITPDKNGHDFMDWYSTKNAVPVIGWIGGNVLRAFRFTIDYPERVAWWFRQTALDPHDLDYIGLTLTSRHGEYFVAGISIQNGKPTVDGVQVGDKLVQVGALLTNSASREAMFAAMHGKPGERRSLILERDGKRFQLEASVTAF